MWKKIRKYLGVLDHKSGYINWLMNYTKPYIPQLSLIMIFDTVGSAATVWLAVIAKNMIDEATAGSSFYPTLLLYLGVVLASELMTILSSLMAVVVYEKFAFGVRKQVYRKVLDTTWLDVMKYHTGDLMTRLTTDTSVVSDGISVVIPSIIKLLIELVITFCTLAYFDWRLALFALVIAPVAALCSFWIGRRLKKLQVKVQESESKYRSFIQESLSNILIVKSFCNEEFATQKLTKFRDERLYWILKKNKTSLVASTTLSLAFQLGYITAFAWGALCISRNAISFGTMTVFLTLVNRVQAPLINLAQSVPKLVSVLASSGRIMELQRLDQEERKEAHIQADSVGISIDKITFGYTEENVLERASLEITPGEFIAVVGKSGIGKTTLVRLIMAFTNAATGMIQIYNEAGQMEKVNAGSRELIAYVPQGNTLFSGTIRENITMGKLDATDAEIQEALKGASADGFIQELPHGIDTVIGEKGHGLSEGQAQRIAIARALIKKAPFLILDEATSSLDEDTELHVLEGIRRWDPAPTCLLITHRRSVLRYCDREICIQNRKLVERGAIHVQDSAG